MLCPSGDTFESTNCRDKIKHDHSMLQDVSRFIDFEHGGHPADALTARKQSRTGNRTLLVTTWATGHCRLLMTSCGESTVPRSSKGREAMTAAFRVTRQQGGAAAVEVLPGAAALWTQRLLAAVLRGQPRFQDVQRRHERLHDLMVGLEALRVAFCLRQHRQGRLSSSKTHWGEIVAQRALPCFLQLSPDSTHNKRCRYVSGLG